MGKYLTYRDVQAIADLPLAKRRKLAIGRGGAKIKPRKFHSNSDEIKELKAEFAETKRFPNPQSRGWCFYFLEALVGLGVNEPHLQSSVFRRVESLMSAEDTKDGNGDTAWKRFESKKPRSKKNSKDVDGRQEQNVLVLQRLTGLTPYGLKILQVGQKVMGQPGGVIDVLVSDTGTRSLRLNLKSAKPINQSKTRGMGSTAELKAAKAKTRKPAKARKAKVAKVVKEAEAPSTETATVEATA